MRSDYPECEDWTAEQWHVKVQMAYRVVFSETLTLVFKRSDVPGDLKERNALRFANYVWEEGRRRGYRPTPLTISAVQRSFLASVSSDDEVQATIMREACLVVTRVLAT